MSPVVFYCSPISPWIYLMFDELEHWLKEENISCEIKVVNLPKLFKLNGNPPLSERSEAKLNHRLQELNRYKSHLGKRAFNVQPKYFPFDMSLSSKVILSSPDGEKLRILRLLGKGCWEDELDMAREDDILAVLEGAGYDGAALLSKATGAEVEKLYEEHTQDAIDNLVFGVPTIRIGKELFWGQDRLDFAKAYVKVHAGES